MEVVNFKSKYKSYWYLKITPSKGVTAFSICGSDDGTYESLQQKVKENSIIYNNTIVINNIDKYGYIKINRSSTNDNELVIETFFSLNGGFWSGNSYSRMSTFLNNIQVIKYTEDLKTLFNFVSFMN